MPRIGRRSLAFARREPMRDHGLMRQALALGTCLTAFVVVGARAAGPTYYMLPIQMRNVIEEHGFTVSRQHILVGTVTCAGLRRYGVRGRAFGGFSCSATARDGSMYLLETVPVTATRFHVTRFGIVSTADESVANCMDRGGTPAACIKQLSS
jgi:hypothetical protein